DSRVHQAAAEGAGRGSADPSIHGLHSAESAGGGAAARRQLLPAPALSRRLPPRTWHPPRAGAEQQGAHRALRGVFEEDSENLAAARRRADRDSERPFEL